MSAGGVTGLIGIAGAVVGGMGSAITSWITQHVQVRSRDVQANRDRRELLYAEFIDEAARLYGDALGHERDDVENLVRLYALVGRMRLGSTPAVIEAAHNVIHAVIAIYGAPSRPLHDLPTIAASGEFEPLIAFSEACRIELVTQLSPRRTVVTR